MVKRRRRGVWPLLVLTAYVGLFAGLAGTLLVHGAIPQLPGAGKVLAEAVARQSWDQHIYMQVGAQMNALAGLDGVGVALLQQALGEQGIAAVGASVSVALVHFNEHRYSALHGWLQWLRYSPPVCFLLALLLTLLRPKEVRSFGSGG